MKEETRGVTGADLDWDDPLGLRPHLHAVTLPEDQIFLLGETERYLLRGRLLAQLVGSLQEEPRSPRQLFALLKHSFTPSEVLYGLSTLLKGGYISTPKSNNTPGLIFRHALGLVPAQRNEQSRTTTAMRVVSTEDFDGPALESSLNDWGLRVSEDGAIWLLVCRDYLDPEMQKLARRARTEGVKWLPCKPTGRNLWLGPIFGSPHGPCWTCLTRQLELNRPVERFLERRGISPKVPSIHTRASVDCAMGLFAQHLLRWVEDSEIPSSHLVEIDLLGPETRTHVVRKRPQCPECGDPRVLIARAGNPIELVSRAKTFVADGGHRVTDPEETYERYRHLISPITGAISTLGPTSSPNEVLRPLYVAAYFVCPNAEQPDFSDFTRTSSGKGVHWLQARASALGEAIERHSALYQGDEFILLGSQRELGSAAVGPATLQQFSARQFRDRESLNVKFRDSRQSIPLPYDPGTPIEWTSAWVLPEASQRYLPFSYCYGQAPGVSNLYCPFNPNGHAAGNCLEEAILQAFFELVERDAVAIWWYNRLIRKRIAFEGLDDYADRLQAEYDRLGWDTWVLDLTTDLRIPTFAALARSRSGGDFTIGFGSHLEPRLALSRALTELNQLYHLQRGGRTPWKREELGEEAFLFPAADASPVRLDQIPNAATRDLREDLLVCLDRVREANLETMVIDMTRPDIGLRAVKVIVPGLRHFWPRLGPGRLYDVPAKMGWLRQPKAESELNPIPLFL
jgi:ribosomal protein S12 methylthiotransferase accessory factor